MAVLPSVKSIRQEDIGPQAPDWIGLLLGPLNTFMESIYSALRKDITFTENIACNIRDFTIQTKSTYSTGGWELITFPSGLRTKPSGVLLLQVVDQTDPYTPMTTAVSLDWQDLSGNIQIRYISGLADSKKYLLRVLVI